MRKLRYFKQIINHPAHDDAGFVFVKERKRELLQMAKEFSPHVPLDSDTDNMSPVLNNIVENGFQYINAEQYNRPYDEKPDVLIWHIVVDNILGDDWVKKVAACHDESTHHVQCEQT